MIGTSLPSDPSLEKALLGAILLDNDSYFAAAKIIGPDTFSDGMHGEIFERAGELIGSGRLFDSRTAKSIVAGVCGEQDPGEFLAGLAAEAGPPSGVRSYAEALADLAAKSRLAVACDKAFGKAMNGAKPFEVIAMLEDEVASVRASMRRSDAGGMADSANTFLQQLGDAYKHQSVDGISWPLPEMDTVMSGPMEPGNLYGFLAASGEGKTSIILQVARQAAEHGHPTLLISYDQAGWQCIRQMVSQRLGFEVDAMRKGNVSESAVDEIFEETKRITSLPLRVEKVDRGGVGTVMNIARGFLRRHKNGKHPLVIIDHIKRIEPARAGDDAGTRVNLITSALKGMSEELHCATLLLNQRNSAGLRRSNPTPIDEDLFGGAGAKEDYDAILTLYRAEHWLKSKLKVADREQEKRGLLDKLAAKAGIAEFSTIKNRYGEAGRFQEVRFVPHFTRFESMRDEREASLFEGA